MLFYGTVFKSRKQYICIPLPGLFLTSLILAGQQREAAPPHLGPPGWRGTPWQCPGPGFRAASRAPRHRGAGRVAWPWPGRPAASSSIAPWPAPAEALVYSSKTEIIEAYLGYWASTKDFFLLFSTVRLLVPSTSLTDILTNSYMVFIVSVF